MIISIAGPRETHDYRNVKCRIQPPKTSTKPPQNQQKEQGAPHLAADDEGELLGGGIRSGVLVRVVCVCAGGGGREIEKREKDGRSVWITDRAWAN